MRKLPVLTTKSFGDINELKKSVDKAIENGAEFFECSVDYAQNGAYVRWIEFTRSSTELEEIKLKKDSLIDQLNELEKQEEELIKRICKPY